MEGYNRAKIRMVNALKCAGEDDIADSISRNERNYLRKASQIYQECGSEDISSYDIQTIMMGMNIYPKKPEDVLSILKGLKESDDKYYQEIENVCQFIISILDRKRAEQTDSISNYKDDLFCCLYDTKYKEIVDKCVYSIEKIMDEDYIYSFLILECVNIISEECDDDFVHQSLSKLSSLSLSFV